MGQRKITADEFFAWQETQDDLYELVDDMPLKMMSGAENRHDYINVNLIAEVRGRLRVPAKAGFGGRRIMRCVIEFDGVQDLPRAPVVTRTPDHKPACFETLRKGFAPQHEGLWRKIRQINELRLSPLSLRREALAEPRRVWGALSGQSAVCNHAISATASASAAIGSIGPCEFSSFAPISRKPVANPGNIDRRAKWLCPVSR